MTYSNKHNTRTREEGFSLIETLVASAILIIVVAGAMTLVVTTSRQVEFSSERVEATFLAQDATEYVISKKRQNILDESPDWLDGFDQCANSSGCGVDTTEDPTTGNPNRYVADNCLGGGCNPLQYNKTGEYFGYGSGSNWEETKYTRKVLLEMINSDEARLTVTVFWDSRETGETEEFTLKTNLFNTRL